MTGNVWEVMEEESAQTSGYWKPEVGKINKIRVLADPVRGMTAFKNNSENRIQYQFIVLPEGATEPVVWGVSAKGALQQIVAIVKANKLTSLVSATIQVAVSGDGMSRKYTILPVEIPTPATLAATQATYPLAALQAKFPKTFGAGTIPPA
jgi:hypothetical protein